MKNDVYVGLGSNLGDKIKYCNDAVEEISRYKGNVIGGRSSFYRTEPWGREDQDWFINCVVKLQTPLGVAALLDFLQNIEIINERIRGDKWFPRTIDLDILFFNNEVINRPEIHIPHPLIQERKFVLIPLNEICPQMVHPVLNQSVKELLEKTTDNKEVIKL